MSVAGQILRLCAVAVLGSVLLGLVRGLPAAPVSVATPAGACQAPLPGAEAIPWISQEQARGLVGKPEVAFVDCRAKEQFEAGHVSGSVHLELQHGQLPPPSLAGLTNAHTVITYCDAVGACQRSLEVASLLRRAGLPDVRVLEGGMPAWLDRGYPAESGTCRDCEATP